MFDIDVTANNVRHHKCAPGYHYEHVLCRKHALAGFASLIPGAPGISSIDILACNTSAATCRICSAVPLYHVCSSIKIIILQLFLDHVQGESGVVQGL
jgi:hypothetical protein